MDRSTLILKFNLLLNDIETEFLYAISQLAPDEDIATTPEEFLYSYISTKCDEGPLKHDFDPPKKTSRRKKKNAEPSKQVDGAVDTSQVTFNLKNQRAVRITPFSNRNKDFPGDY